jgi:hypothetical protein
MTDIPGFNRQCLVVELRADGTRGSLPGVTLVDVLAAPDELILAGRHGHRGGGRAAVLAAGRRQDRAGEECQIARLRAGSAYG